MKLIFLFFICCVNSFLYSITGTININSNKKESLQIYINNTRQLPLEHIIDQKKLIKHISHEKVIYISHIINLNIPIVTTHDLYNLSSADYRLVINNHSTHSFVKFSTYQIESCSRFFTYLPGSICFLIGTSSAGKSSILEYLKQEAIKSSSKTKLLFTGEDICYLNGVVSTIRNLAPNRLKKQLNSMDSGHLFQYFFTSLGEYVCGSDLMKKYDKILLSNEWESLKQKWLSFEETFETNLEKHRYKQTIHALKKGYTIVDDVACIPLYLRIMLSNLMVCNINTIVIYCSPEKLLERIIYRNAKDFLHPNKEMRLFFPFHYFRQLYVPSNDLTAIPVSKSSIKSISFERSIKPYIEAIPKGHLSADQNTLQKMITNWNVFQSPHRHYILTHWFKNSDTTHITPAFPYDLILDNGKYSLEQICTIIKPILGIEKK